MISAHLWDGLCDVAGRPCVCCGKIDVFGPALFPEWRDDMASETNADRRARQRDALKGQLQGLTANADAVKHLAEEVREAAHTDPATHRRVIEIFERLGVTWPVGFKP